MSSTPSASIASGSASVSGPGSQTNLFPTTTASGVTRDNGIGGGSPTTYYFVFLGVLVVLLIIAASLAYRAFRIRRQFRTATQIALMRGEPPPRLQEDYWALGVLSPWRMEEVMREANGGNGLPDGERGSTAWLARRFGSAGVWRRIPVLHEWEAYEGEKEGSGLMRVMPISIQSLAPPPLAPPPPISPPEPTSSPSRFTRRRRGREPPSDLPTEPVNQDRTIEEEEITQNDPFRIAVIIQMPHDDNDGRLGEAGYREEDEDDYDYDDDEKSGWKGGMELGVWAGVASNGYDGYDGSGVGGAERDVSGWDGRNGRGESAKREGGWDKWQE